MLNNSRRIWRSLKPEERSYLKAGFFWIALIGLFAIWIIPLLFTKFALVDYTSTGPIGDTIGGISNPFIGLLTAVLTFLAFYIQYKANRQQIEQFSQTIENQKHEAVERDTYWKIEQFESRFFELLNIHNANVDAINIENVAAGRTCFVLMFYELKICYRRLNKISKTIQLSDTAKNSQTDIFQLAYKIFYYGTGTASELHYRDTISISDKEILDAFLENSKQNSSLSEGLLDPDPNRIIPSHIEGKKLPYTLFNGHMHRLGHYYRHLFMMAKFVVDNRTLNEEEKYGFIKILRAQLSDFEQLHLYYNALNGREEDWLELFTKYRLIKNLPIPLTKGMGSYPLIYFRKKIEEYKAKGIDLFEFRDETKGY